MRSRTAHVVPLSLALAGMLVGAPAAAQANPHVGHVAEGFRGTPNGQGLLPTAIAEAEVAAQHAALAARDLEDLNGMKRHAGHVLHAVDPAEGSSGPGAGYGVKRAAEGVAQHIELAARADGASDAVKTHATHIATSARNTAQRAEQIAELARQIEDASETTEAADAVREMNELAQALVAGVDANGDGRVGWQEGEGGLQQAQTHLGLLQGG